jgi:hypothetical protein
MSAIYLPPVTFRRIWRATASLIWYIALRPVALARSTTLPPVMDSRVSSPSISAVLVASVAL